VFNLCTGRIITGWWSMGRR